MGSLVSKRAATAVTSTAKPRPAPTKTASASASASPSARPPTEVTATLKSPPTPHRRKTPQEWAATLSQITYSITSAPYPNTAPPTAVRPGADHSAQRSSRTTAKLPRRRHDADDRVLDLEGRLSQNQILALFNLRRADPALWAPARVAERFALDTDDVRNLLAFTRTYTGRLDKDGWVRAYYKADLDDTVIAFERD